MNWLLPILAYFLLVIFVFFSKILWIDFNSFLPFFALVNFFHFFRKWDEMILARFWTFWSYPGLMIFAFFSKIAWTDVFRFHNLSSWIFHQQFFISNFHNFSLKLQQLIFAHFCPFSPFFAKILIVSAFFVISGPSDYCNFSRRRPDFSPFPHFLSYPCRVIFAFFRPIWTFWFLLFVSKLQ